MWVRAGDQVPGVVVPDLERLLPPTSPLFERSPAQFAAGQWEDFVATASKLTDEFPVLGLLARLPAVFLPDSQVDTVTRWLTNHPEVMLAVGSANQLSNATSALITANLQKGIRTDAVVRAVMFASAPLGIGKYVSIWFAAVGSDLRAIT
jgi:hypothetical protein